MYGFPPVPADAEAPPPPAEADAPPPVLLEQAASTRATAKTAYERMRPVFMLLLHSSRDDAPRALRPKGWTTHGILNSIALVKPTRQPSDGRASGLTGRCGKAMTPRAPS